MRKRLSGLTVIGITSFSAAKCGPGWSDPSDRSVYMPISPSSAFETYTKVAALGCALKSKDEAAMRIAALKLACMLHPFHVWGAEGARSPGWQWVEGWMCSLGRERAVLRVVGIRSL